MTRSRKRPADSAQSKTPRMPGHSTRENRETRVASAPDVRRRPVGEGDGRTADMNVARESDEGVVPTNDPNNDAWSGSAEDREGRPSTKENPEHSTSPRTQSRSGAPGESTGLLGVRQAAQREKRLRFTALLHHVSVAQLRASYFALKREAAPGVDGVTWDSYQVDLERRLATLHGRVHRGSYRALPSKRVYIPKASGGQRPLGIAALEDKIVQHAVSTVLTAVYEVDFLGFSYGFRPGRSQHDALDALWAGLMERRVNWVLDADIRGFFDTLDHDWLMRFVAHRIADPRVLRLIRKWLRAGVLEGDIWTTTEIGTPQGAVLSPLLANIYLHYVFDCWVHQWRQQAATGDVVVVRYADDIVMGFEHRADAERCVAAWQARLAQFGLALHPDKTRLLEFGRHAVAHRQQRGEGKPETFDFLGFTHYCGKFRSGRFLVRRQTMRTRLRRKLQAVKAELRRRRHEPLPAQGQWVRRIVVGHFAYYAVPGNEASLERFRAGVRRLWHRALRRRGQRRPLTWARLRRVVQRWIPSVRIMHPYPEVRFAVRHPR
jgi:RNA-directed DNA polymerase